MAELVKKSWTGGWMNPTAGLDDVEKWKFLTLPGLELRPLRRPARSQSLYRLCYVFFKSSDDGVEHSKWLRYLDLSNVRHTRNYTTFRSLVSRIPDDGQGPKTQKYWVQGDAI
jgi:hypothetical protein